MDNVPVAMPANTAGQVPPVVMPETGMEIALQTGMSETGEAVWNKIDGTSTGAATNEPMAPESAAHGRDYAVLCLLTSTNVLNFVDRQLLGSFANFIKPDLGLSNTQVRKCCFLVLVRQCNVAGISLVCGGSSAC